MKRILSLTLGLLISVGTFAQLDRSIRPQAAPAKELNFGEYEVFELENGLKIIVVENKKLPRVSFSLVVDRDPIMEGENAGYVSIAGSLLRQGTTNRTKDALDEEVDFIGANLFTGSANVFASGLSKHTETLVELLADVALNPAFPEEEFQKLLKQSKSGIESAKDSPDELSSRLFNRSLYGADHPYGELETEASLDNISLEDCKEYYNTYWAPNITYITVVGDIKARKAKKLIKKHFGDWARKEVPKHEYDTPARPAKNVVNFYNRNSSVQSVLSIGNTIDLKPGSEDVVKVRLMNQILGGGSMGRLFRNIREDKGYTYGAYSNYDTDKLVGSFSAGASVRNEVTDSSVIEFIKEFKRLQNEPVSAEDLQAAKNNIIGSFGRSLESPQTIASFALSIQRYGLAEDYYQTYLQRLDAVTAEDIMATAKKYLATENLVISVVGKAAEVAPSLEKFGEVTYYDFNGDVTGPPSLPVPEGVSAQDVLNNYLSAIGGEALDQVKDLKIESKVEIAGMPMAASGVTLRKRPNLYMNEISVEGMGTVQKQTFDGTTGKVSGMQGNSTLEGEELEQAKLDGIMFIESKYAELGFKTELTAINMIEGEKAYVMEVTKPNGDKQTEYYSVESGLKLKEESSVETPQGALTISQSYSDYKEVSGVKFPGKIVVLQGPQKIVINQENISINNKLKKSDFQ